jgi:hypothetical protein
MSYKRVGTAGDLVRFGCSLKIECTFCHAARTLSGIEVYQLLGNRRLDRLTPRLKCRRCRRKEAKLTVLDPVYPQ